MRRLKVPKRWSLLSNKFRAQGDRASFSRSPSERISQLADAGTVLDIRLGESAHSSGGLHHNSH